MIEVSKIPPSSGAGVPLLDSSCGASFVLVLRARGDRSLHVWADTACSFNGEHLISSWQYPASTVRAAIEDPLLVVEAGQVILSWSEDQATFVQGGEVCQGLVDRFEPAPPTASRTSFSVTVLQLGVGESCSIGGLRLSRLETSEDLGLTIESGGQSIVLPLCVEQSETHRADAVVVVQHSDSDRIGVFGGEFYYTVGLSLDVGVTPLHRDLGYAEFLARTTYLTAHGPLVVLEGEVFLVGSDLELVWHRRKDWTEGVTRVDSETITLDGDSGTFSWDLSSGESASTIDTKWTR